MSKVILGVTISLDGFAEDIRGSVGALYPDLETLDKTEAMRESQRSTGAVVMAWKEYAMADDPDWFAGNYEYQVPIFVVTDRVPGKRPKESGDLKFTFVTDGWSSAVRQAQKAAGEKEVNIIGSASTTGTCLRLGLADELHVDIIPLFLGEGFRPFEDIGEKNPRLERLRVVELPAGRVHVTYKVTKQTISSL